MLTFAEKVRASEEWQELLETSARTMGYSPAGHRRYIVVAYARDNEGGIIVPVPLVPARTEEEGILIAQAFNLNHGVSTRCYCGSNSKIIFAEFGRK